MNSFLSWICKIFLKPIVGFIWIKTVIGKENIPSSNFILASNHQSHWDQVINAYICVPRPFTYLGQVDKYWGFEKFLRNLIYKIGGVIPVNRLDAESKRLAVEKCIRMLKKGYVLIMYPEGTRSKDGNIHEGKPGLGRIYLSTNVPILPVAIKGNFEIMPIGSVFPKFKKIIGINIGKPLLFPKEYEEARYLSAESKEYKEMCSKITNKVMEEIKNLFGQIQ